MVPANLYDAGLHRHRAKALADSGRRTGQPSGGGALPSVRVDVNPTQLASYGLTVASLQSVLSMQNSDLAKGQITDGDVTEDILANDQISHAAEYKPLIVGYQQWRGRPPGGCRRCHRLRAECSRRRVSEWQARDTDYHFPPARREYHRYRGSDPGATARLSRHPSLLGIDVTVVMDRTTTIRASVNDVERTLLISITLVIIVVFVFLRNGRATLIPGVAVPVSLIGTFAMMYLFGYSIDNLSLMALTISTGFVVDDAIVVMENITRHMENGMKPMAAALKGAEEIGFTVFTISISLIAVFIPLLLMGGIVGRLFREFAITLSTAIVVSMVDLADDHANDVRLLAEKQTHGKAWPAVHGQREDVRWDALRVSQAACVGCSTILRPRCSCCPHDRAQRLADRQNTQGLFPCGRHRSDRRRSAGARKIPLSLR